MQSFLERHRYWIVTVLFLCVVPHLRALWNWGDSGQIIVLLEEAAPDNFRWLNGIVILDLIYGIAKPFIAARAFLTCTGIFLGAVIQPFLLQIIEYSSRNSSIYQRLVVHLWIITAFSTWTLISGYLEIYPFVQFSVILIIWAFLLPERSKLHDAITGAILGFAPSIYMGLLPLYPLGILAGRRSSPFYCSWIGGILTAAWLLTMNWGFSIPAFIGLFSFYHEGPFSYYVGISELPGPEHLKNLIRTIIIYDPFLPVIVIAAAIFYRLPWKIGFKSAVLIGYSAFYFAAFIMKRHVLGFADWDIFTWAVILWNITLIPLLLLHVNYKLLGLRIAILLMTWYAFHKPSQDIDFLPYAARLNAINNRRPFRKIPDTGPMADIRRDIIEKRSKRSSENHRYLQTFPDRE
jgi:hypothetical protein